MLHDWAFAGDIYFLEKVHKVIKDNEVKTVIETGTWKGTTTKLLSAMCDKVYTIEINEQFFNEAKDLDDYPNIKRIHGNSPEEIKNIFKNNNVKFPILFFLDAHWDAEYLPLLDELEEISQLENKKIFIAIHDFYNPFHLEFGYDKYGDTIFDINYIKEKLYKIYGKGNYKYNYNIKATGDKRGIIFIYPSFYLMK